MCVFNGNYNFFDYKYNIPGYTGQDFGGLPQYLYLVISIILLVILLIVFRKCSKDKVRSIVRIVSIFLIVIYFVKTIWESIYDIKLTGSFNTGLLPFDTCSIIMIAGLISGFGKGNIKKMADCWLATGGIVGGIANMLFLNALKYYPLLSFGAFYSLIWHFFMVFIGLLLIVTNYIEIKYSSIIYGYIFHLIITAVIIPIDYIYSFDFMLYLNLGGIPIFEDIASFFKSINLQMINTVMMLLLYFIAFNIVFFIPLGIKKLYYLCHSNI